MMVSASGAFSNGTCSTMLATCSPASLLAMRCLNLLRKDRTSVTPAAGALHLLRSSDKITPWYNSHFKCWKIPSIMQGVDTRVVNVSNCGYGKQFVSSETMKVDNFIFPILASLLIPFAVAMAFFAPTRALLERMMPAPGTGPSVDVQKNGYFRVKCVVKARLQKQEDRKDVRWPCRAILDISSVLEW